MNDEQALELLIDGMTKHLGNLRNQQKQLESRIKALKADVELVEQESAATIAAAKDAAAKEIAAITQSVDPYRDLAEKIRTQRDTYAALQRSMEEETMRLQAVRHQVLQSLDERIARATQRLERLSQEETIFRNRIALV